MRRNNSVFYLKGMNPNYPVWEQAKFHLDNNEDRLDRLMNEVAKIPSKTSFHESASLSTQKA